MAAYEEAIGRTSTGDAPWYVVPADHKWFRDWAVSRIVLETLEDMDPRYPEPDESLDGVRVT
jgi:polyphosphate kinase 2 (PPK2 family)